MIWDGRDLRKITWLQSPVSLRLEGTSERSPSSSPLSHLGRGLDLGDLFEVTSNPCHCLVLREQRGLLCLFKAAPLSKLIVVGSLPPRAEQGHYKLCVLLI